MLTALQHHDLHLKISKCSFNATEVDFLRFKINTEDIYINLKRIWAVEEWLLSENVYELQVFLNFVNFFWRFIKNYSWIAALLLNLLKTERNKKKTEIISASQSSQQKPPQMKEQKSSKTSSDYSAHSSQVEEESQAVCSSQVSEELQQKNVVIISFSLSEVALKVFKALKKIFTSASLLHYFDENKLMRVETDISEFAIDRILTQQFKINNQMHWLLITYYSKKLLNTEI